ncbi:MAG: SUMF1/EgtB/PvdO family nonheme iron enzyme [Candidatus Sumerlaeota bacterium]|nr:SUMF1/EgtB/PvdO family nonheme iron enzyme [Candidatus Sumerlaeota bacterium]
MPPIRYSLLAAAVAIMACNKPGQDSRGAEESNSVRVTEIMTKSGVVMVYVPGGEFLMGDEHGNPDESPAHKMTVSGFLMDKFEATHEMFKKAQLPDPSHWQDNPNLPVERVRWRDAKQYCNERSLQEGLAPCYNEKTADWDCDHSANGYRLPTEAEWEYACRAGTDGPYDFGAPDPLRLYAWFADNADQKTHPAGQKRPNRWGLHDMYGNVSEWCEDVYDPSYYKDSPAVDPHGPPNPGKDVRRVIRGGSWKASADMCRATFRQGERTGDTDACFLTDFCGFRCVRRVTMEELKRLRTAAR